MEKVGRWNMRRVFKMEMACTESDKKESSRNKVEKAGKERIDDVKVKHIDFNNN